MDLLFNELSCYPLAEGDREAERRLGQLCKTFKKANATFRFKRIVFDLNFR